jgi:hypothetical protein
MADYDKDMAEERIQIKDDKKKIYEDDQKKKDNKAKMMPDHGPKDYKVAPDGVKPDEMSHGHPHGGGPKSYKDHGAKMTADPQSYRSSMSKHWSGSNSRFLTEGGDVIDQTAQRDSM